jgi:hypothetical protein
LYLLYPKTEAAAIRTIKNFFMLFLLFVLSAFGLT